MEDAPTVIRSVRAVGFPVLAVATSYPLEKLADANWAVKSLEGDALRKSKHDDGSAGQPDRPIDARPPDRSLNHVQDEPHDS